jgi:hypothetical protein
MCCLLAGMDSAEWAAVRAHLSSYNGFHPAAVHAHMVRVMHRSVGVAPPMPQPYKPSKPYKSKSEQSSTPLGPLGRSSSIDGEVRVTRQQWRCLCWVSYTEWDGLLTAGWLALGWLVQLGWLAQLTVAAGVV